MFRRALPILALGIFLILLGACSDNASRLVKAIGEHADKICACKDKACATKESEALFASVPTAKSRYAGKAQRKSIASARGLNPTVGPLPRLASHAHQTPG